LLAQIQADLGAGYTVLDPLYLAEGRHDSRWRLVVNVPERELLDWREHWAAMLDR
jgi:predicted transcriptional regulator of viral defense system